ncbi:hypothetical protein OHB41_36485 [Streptomyces sp. NBC_01571]|uniref:hypothetical protein n=1 Tax=Streptomyces sp. NBC_01571 TaxID=2975883 RepID=UPI00225157FB|nr:hypothetical protein [Streptomyces sp. NBC_01571]MCX4578588.1 hypothetical protein [Streptomyces sp. NBC_01571]
MVKTVNPPLAGAAPVVRAGQRMPVEVPTAPGGHSSAYARTGRPHTAGRRRVRLAPAVQGG